MTDHPDSEPDLSGAAGGANLPRPLPTPTEMIAYLDRFVCGQQQAKRDLTTAFYTHCLARMACTGPESPVRDFGKQHVLMLGPTGSGKSYLVRTLARYLRVPVAYVTATSLSETGYVGDKIESCLERLIDAAKGDATLAQRGFVFVDEVDKIRRPPVVLQRDVSGLGVQNALLTLLDGRTITHDGVTLDSSDVLFVFAGAFAGMEEILRARHVTEEQVGFAHGDTADARPLTLGELYRKVSREDLEEFGFVPELIGRFASVSVLDALTEADLVRILTDTEESILRKQAAYFALHAIDLEFSPEGIRAIARRAVERDTGARGIVTEVLRSVDAVDYRPLELHQEGVVRIVVGESTILRGEPPTLVIDREAAAKRSVAAVELRSRAYNALPGNLQPLASGTSTGFTDVRGWSKDRIREAIVRIREELGWSNTSPSAKAWWESFEKSNPDRLGLVLRLAEELRMRRATITEFFLSVLYSNCDNIQANLHYFDYLRLKKEEDRKKRKWPDPGGKAKDTNARGDEPTDDGGGDSSK